MFKIVAADARSPRDGRFIEALGTYEPSRTPAALTLDAERIQYWLGVGAQPSDTVRSLLSSQGIMLKVHLQRKGKTAEEIETEFAKWSAAKAQRAGQPTKKQRRAARKQAQSEAPAAE